MSARLFVMVLIAGLLGGIGCSTPDPQPPVPVTRDVLVGTWRHELPNREVYEIMLFDSGIVGFIHATEKLPIAQAFGRWSFDEGTLDLHIVGGEPDAREFPLANRLFVQRIGTRLVFDVEGEPGTWSAHDRYGAGREGAAERQASDERGWTSLVESAEANATNEL